MTIKPASIGVLTVLLSSASLFGRTLPRIGQESGQGWQVLFDGRTLAGWHVSAPPEGGGRTGPVQPPQPGQVGTPKPCVTGSHWEVVDGLLTPCGEPTGYLTSDRS